MTVQRFINYLHGDMTNKNSTAEVAVLFVGGKG